MQSPGFSKFRELLDTWDGFLIESEFDEKIDELMSPFVFFFKKDDQIFGAGEDSRVVFAKMKNPDKDLPDGWKDEATFSAHNLTKSVSGEPSQNIFVIKDLNKIKVVDNKDASELLRKEMEKLGEKVFSNNPKVLNLLDLSRILNKDPNSPNFIQANEE